MAEDTFPLTPYTLDFEEVWNMVYVKRIFCFLAFIVGLAVLFVAASFVLMPKNNMAEFGMEEVSANGILGEKENSIDILVLGDSESYSAFIPAQIWKEKGYTSYVCGTSGQTLDYSVMLLHRAFEKQSPKFVILETDAIYRKVPRGKAAVSRLSPYLPVFQYHDRWKSLGWHDFKGKISYTWTDDYKGYKYVTTVAPSVKADHMKPTNAIAEIPPQNIQYVKELKAFCDENNAKFLLLSTPSTVNWNYPRHNGIQKLAEEIGCEYIDLNLMNEQIQIDWSQDTRDEGDHLNHSGAMKVTHFLSEYLSQTGMLIDHRPDPEYAKWHDCLKNIDV